MVKTKVALVVLAEKNCGVMTKTASKTQPSSVEREMLVPCVNFGPLKITVEPVMFAGVERYATRPLALIDHVVEGSLLKGAYII